MDTIRYSIRPYDTIWMLAQVFNTTVDSIMALNPGIVPTNLQIGQVITIRPGEFGRFPEGGVRFPAFPSEPPTEAISVRLAELNKIMRMLWGQHVTWERFAAEGIIENLDSAPASAERALRVPQDFADTLMGYYGEEIAGQFADLFTEHQTIALEIARALKDDDMNALEDAEQRWYANADVMARFLASINPEVWYEDSWDAMLYEHLNLVMADMVNMANRNFEESIAMADATQLQAFEIADIMAEGIDEQFPIY